MGLERAIKALEIDDKMFQLDLVEVVKRYSKRIYPSYRVLYLIHGLENTL